MKCYLDIYGALTTDDEDAGPSTLTLVPASKLSAETAADDWADAVEVTEEEYKEFIEAKEKLSQLQNKFWDRRFSPDRPALKE